MAMGLAIAKLAHVTVTAREFAKGGNEGAVGVGRERGRELIEGRVVRCASRKLEGLGEEIIAGGEGFTNFGRQVFGQGGGGI